MVCKHVSIGVKLLACFFFPSQELRNNSRIPTLWGTAQGHGLLLAVSHYWSASLPLSLMRIAWINLSAVKNLGHPSIFNAHYQEQFFPVLTPEWRACSSPEFCLATWRVTAGDLILLQSSLCHTALNFTSCTNSPLLSKSQSKGFAKSSVLWSKGVRQTLTMGLCQVWDKEKHKK